MNPAELVAAAAAGSNSNQWFYIEKTWFNVQDTEIDVYGKKTR